MWVDKYIFCSIYSLLLPLGMRLDHKDEQLISRKPLDTQTRPFQRMRHDDVVSTSNSFPLNGYRNGAFRFQVWNSSLIWLSNSSSSSSSSMFATHHAMPFSLPISGSILPVRLLKSEAKLAVIQSLLLYGDRLELNQIFHSSVG